MKQKLTAMLLLLCTLFAFCGCEETLDYLLETQPVTESSLSAPDDSSADSEAEPDSDSVTNPDAEPETSPATEAPATEPEPPAPTDAPDSLPETLDPDGSYTTPEDVAAYLYTYGALPDNFLTKKEARNLGWVSAEGNLWEVAPGMSIGGDYFGNFEGLLPEGDYRECDVNYEGGFRGSERIIFIEDCSAIYYTDDHYESFTQLY